jgi:hypothetical protein
MLELAMGTDRRRPFEVLRERLPGHALAVLAGLALVAVAGRAEAQMRQGTRPGFFEASVGPVVGITDPGRLWFQSSIEIGGHFSRNSGGPALSGSFDFMARPDWFGMEVGVKFRWDIQVRRSTAFYLAPTVRTGYALFSHRGDAPSHFFNLQLGFELRMILRNRLIIFFRPLSFDIDIRDHVEVAYDPGVGLGVTF